MNLLDADFGLDFDEDLFSGAGIGCGYGEGEGYFEQIEACHENPDLFWKVQSEGHIEHLAAKLMRHHAEDLEQVVSRQHTQTVRGDQTITVNGEQQVTVGGTRRVVVGEALELRAGQEIRLVVGETALLINDGGAWLKTQLHGYQRVVSSN